MKNFLLHIFIFTAILLVILSGLTFLADYNYRHYHVSHAFDELYHCLTGTDYHDVVILGSSRSMRHFNPSIIDSILHVDSYNLGADATKVDAQCLKYRLYLEHRKLPKVIIKEVNYYDFSGYELAREREKYIPLLEHKWVRDFCQRTAIFSKTAMYCYPLKYMDEIIMFKNALMRKKDETMAYKGYTSINDCSYHKQEEGIIFSQRKAAVDAFKCFLSDCNRNGIKVILVFSPWYLEGNEECNNKNEWDAFIQDICSQYGCVFLDYHTGILGLTDRKSYFHDRSHLNTHGADMFSKKIAEKIDSLKIISGN